MSLICLCAAGCWHLTRDQADAAKTGAGTIGMAFGIPRPLGEAIGGAVIAALGLTAGHKHGRRRQRQCDKAKPPVTA